MALTLPTSLGNPTLPQAGRASRVASINTGGLGQDLVEGARIAGNAWHRTAAGLQDVAGAYDKLQLQQDQKEAKDWINQLMQQKTSLLYGDGTDANPGYMNMKGDGAVGAAKKTADQLDKLRKDMLGKVSNKQVGAMFDGASSQLIAPDHEDILKHASQQHLVALDTTDDGTIAAATDMLSANPTDPTTAQNSTSLIAGSISAKLDRAGITDPIARQQAILEGVSGAKAQAIQTALVRDPTAGAMLYAKWKDQIQGTDQAKLEQSIVAAEDRQMRKQEHQVYMAKQQQEIASNEAQTEYAHAIILHASNPSKYPDVSLEAIGTDKRLLGPDVLTLYNMQKAADKGETDSETSRGTLSKLFPRLTAPYGDPNKITTYKEINQAMAGGMLSKTDWAFAAGIIDSGLTEEGQKLQPSIAAADAAALQVIGKPNDLGIIKDSNRSIKLQQFRQDMYDQIESYKKANKDPRELFDATSKAYVLSPANLGKYGVSTQDTMDSIKSRMSGNTFTNSDNLPVGEGATPSIPTFTSSADPAFQALPSGSVFYDENNKLRTKK